MVEKVSLLHQLAAAVFNSSMELPSWSARVDSH